MKIYKPILILGMLAALIVVSFTLGTNLFSTARSTEASILPQENTDDWQIYTDERFNFGLRYPPGWYLNIIPADAGGGGLQISNYDLSANAYPQKGVPSDYLKIEIMVIGGDPRMPGQSLQEWRHARADYDETKIRQESLTIINGHEALEETAEYDRGMEMITIYFPFIDQTYGETVLYISATPFHEPLMEEIFRSIVTSLEFGN